MRTLTVWGVLLLLGGLLTGLAIPLLALPRLGLSAHLTAIECALVLIAFAYLWPRLRLGERPAMLTCIAAVAGSYALWLAFVVGAAFGAGAATPLAGAGTQGPPAAESLVAALLGIGVIGTLVATGAVFVSLLRGGRAVSTSDG